MESNKDLFKDFKKTLKEDVGTPQQTVVKIKEKVDESKITYWTRYHQQLKMLAVIKKTSVKQLLDDAVLQIYEDEFNKLNL
jgi:hypothetical protein